MYFLLSPDFIFIGFFDANMALFEQNDLYQPNNCYHCRENRYWNRNVKNKQVFFFLKYRTLCVCVCGGVGGGMWCVCVCVCVCRLSFKHILPFLCRVICKQVQFTHVLLIVQNLHFSNYLYCDTKLIIII